MDAKELAKYQDAQRIAKSTIKYLSFFIQEGMSESDISRAADDFMRSRGVTSFWYHGIGSLVLVGRRTPLSVSGRDYKPTAERVGWNDLVTVDLSPQIGEYWGDHARSFVIAHGRVVTGNTLEDTPVLQELREGIATEQKLHKRLRLIATPDMTYDALFQSMNAAIARMGYANLDYKGNLGHSIEKDKDDREYIERGCQARLGEKLFTFEPHIRKREGSYGFKQEDIYYFLDRILLRM